MINMSILIYFSSKQAEFFTSVKKAVAESTPLSVECGVKNESGEKWQWLNVFWDEEPGLHSGTAIRWDDESDIDAFIEYLENEFGFARFEYEFPKMEKQALSNCIDYINRCENRTEGGYKESVRDAFTPFVQRYPRTDIDNAVNFYYDRILTMLSMSSQPILDGVKSGLRSVYTVRLGW